MNWTAEHSPFTQIFERHFQLNYSVPVRDGFTLFCLMIAFGTQTASPIQFCAASHAVRESITSALFSVSLGAILTPKQNWRQWLCKILGWQTKGIMVCHGTFCRGSSGQFSATSFPGLFGSRFYPKAVTLIIQPLFISVWQVKKPYLREDSPVL